MKGTIIITVALVAVALGACRRQEAVPMKLGVDILASSVSAE